ncbi:polysaccharide deacetylase [Luteitalea sp. TBR-22]|uniref:polysaccharide deacetylase family protein n=1 Tax=Luteitalea sp. TBR-22 TaxID=2802971 RepID=UPI001AF773F2|nr:polysaccharide deacetylase family protein [Luteitalea sp. TBR-22]BCS36065.1 polysaccharide deacetylase [Luteitalea sp. TBR-22]
MFIRHLDGARSRYRRQVASYFSRRTVPVDLADPLISFTFDDFPASALRSGGPILERHGATATYYVSLGLLGMPTPTGRIVEGAALPGLLASGHELGCHTYSHCHSWNTAPARFRADVLRNRDVLADLLPEGRFETFSYPIAPPRPRTKILTSNLFRCSRLGGQKINAGYCDLNQLSAFFLEKANGDIGEVERIINEACAAKGWLIVATHDIDEQPTPFGCTPSFFSEVVRRAVGSGARILPVGRALDVVLRGRA